MHWLPTFATARETARMALAPSLALLSVPSTSFILSSISFCLVGSRPCQTPPFSIGEDSTVNHQSYVYLGFLRWGYRGTPHLLDFMRPMIVPLEHVFQASEQQVGKEEAWLTRRAGAMCSLMFATALDTPLPVHLHSA